MNEFLASVRSLNEAESAHRIGADWIDLKEPSAGALGAVDAQTVIDVVQWLQRQQRRASLSATIGDCWGSPSLMPGRVETLHRSGIEYAKIGVFARAPSTDLLHVIRQCCSIGSNIILVCFAETPPSRRDIGAFAAAGISGAMLDTAGKTGQSLTGLLTTDVLAEFVTTVHRHDLICGLAGSLSINDIGRLSSLGADYLGFRGALCRNAVRESEFSEPAAARVRAAIDRAKQSGNAPNAEPMTPPTHGLEHI